MRLRHLSFLVAFLAAPAAAQTPAGITVSGVVRDGLSRAPLAGATVQLVSATDALGGTRSVVSDSIGGFTFSGVADGRYTLGFLHPMLDSLGIEPPQRAVQVERGRPVRLDVASPSAAQIRAELCGPATADSGAVVMGVVRGAGDGAPVAGASVAGVWSELTLGRGGMVPTTKRIVATTAADGLFALCNVPRGGLMAVGASRGADSTDMIDLEVPADGFLHRALYVGAARADAAVAATAAPSDSAAPARARRTGEGTLRGTVVATAGGRPLEGALVSIAGSAQTRTDATGAWTLANVPYGTRLLEVRAVGFFPERRPVDVVQGGAPLRLSLQTMQAVLDAVKVTARYSEGLAGFEDRRRSGPGRYFTAADISKRLVIQTSDLFKNMSGVRLEGDSILMRGPFGDCTPGFFIDGHYFDTLDRLEIDNFARPDRVRGIEIYTDASAPAQFRRLPGAAGGDAAPCGSIVIWTR
ncbi:MSCRAMM family protein [Roseisolibacter agri]|uniref:TonB-dependent receptor plug domain-containing protein n=1 Tax=Roseisolibacter agri TaxID=2014610 RepID=A0AA37V7P7_9BACT|nr:carboxypeptidase regulatory-like domain-containing protein [Roseisolibacter agri]GLC26921.1 hypothetical protein rosag_34340 [Roseisolibacter agri]